ncbi:MAG: 3-dehydroquinate synthase [Planctomycetaceae bacterium]
MNLTTTNSSTDHHLVHVNLADRSYDIVVASGELPQAARMIESWSQVRQHKSGSRSALVVTDVNVLETHAGQVVRSLREAGWRCEVEALPAGETTKSLEQANRLYDRLIDLQADRHTLVVAVGGGVIGDLAGFVAATYARGIPFVQIPTTLLSQVDSSVGGKVGVNHPRAKNMIGAFYQPLGVLIDTSLLETLPDREYRAGLAEVVKYGVILDASFFEYLETHVAELNRRIPEVLRHVVARSCRLKADVVEHDEFERTGLRAVLNYGHTFAHAFEALCGYGELLHGEAVAIGMVYASRLADRLGRIPVELTTRQEQLLRRLSLPVRLPHPKALPIDSLLGRMQLDKKTVGGQLRFVLPSRLGHVELVDGVPPAEVTTVIAEFQERS